MKVLCRKQGLFSVRLTVDLNMRDSSGSLFREVTITMCPLDAFLCDFARLVSVHSHHNSVTRLPVTNKPIYLLYLIRDTYPGGAHGKAGHFRAFPAPPGALSDSHIQFPQRPVFLSEEKVLILPKYRMYLRPVGTDTSLAAVTGNGGKFPFQNG